ncbi:MAG: serine dehydratase subunit alpha family protein, partial [Bacteroidales bacterium]|nr:serine dehydratase subunit alpha family protein [Bacteroidales bacterium]
FDRNYQALYSYKLTFTFTTDAGGLEHLNGKSFQVNQVDFVSANILKNGMGVGIPGTGMIGLHIASALAATCGKSKYKLEVLKDLGASSIDKAKKLVDDKKVSITLADTPLKLYIKANVTGTYKGVEHTASTVIKDNHDSIVSVELDGVSVFSTDNSAGEGICSLSSVEKSTLDYKLSVKEILEFVKSVQMTDIEFILDSVKLNKALADEGLRADYGLKVGRTILSAEHNSIFGDSVMTYAMAATAAASDARMAGCTMPAMSNSGSGNQGITVTVPVIAVAEKLHTSREDLARALTLSHLIAIHIKGYLGKLSALCGCVIASTGSSCGIVYLKGGGYDQICYAIKNMIGNITGMVCDGAKVGCALKVASGVSSSIQAAVLAMDNICISSNDGIIEDCIEKTICNLGTIGSKGMQSTDKMILDIMVCK